MDPEVKEFLVRIVQSISMAMVWLLLNMTFGIYFDFAFFEGRPTVGNLLYYFGFLISLTLLILYLRKKWKGWEEKNY